MTPAEFRSVVKTWSWLRSLDHAFVGFLADLDGGASPDLLLAAALASYQLGRGHICLDLAATLRDPERALALPLSGAIVAAQGTLPAMLNGLTVERWRQALLLSHLVSQGDGSSPLVLYGDRLYLRRYWQSERQVAAHIAARLAAETPIPNRLRETLDRLFPRDGAGEEIDWQRIACCIAARRALTVITGGPGTGKTTTVVKLLALLQSSAADAGAAFRIRLTAPTGKAAARLTESIGGALKNRPELAPFRDLIPTEAATLHRLLGSRPGSRHFRHDRTNPLHADLVVVDEASMIDLEMMAALLDALPAHARLVLLGDKDQLASVEAGSVLGDLCRNVGRFGYSADTVAWVGELSGESLETAGQTSDPLVQQIVELRYSRRFGEASGIGRLARAVNAGDVDGVGELLNPEAMPSDLACVLLQGAEDRRLESIAAGGGAEPASGYAPYLKELCGTRPAADACGADFDAWARRVLAAFDRFQVLCALREGPWGVDGLNRRIEAALLARGLIERAHGWYEGRPVLVTRNDYRLGLMNGDVGIALRFPSPADPGGAGVLRAVFPQADGALRRVLPSRLTEAETVFAMTVHKSQGSEFDHVALVLPDTRVPVMTRELLYTGITRAKSRLSLLVPEASVIGYAVRTPVQRVTGLADWLAGGGT